MGYCGYCTGTADVPLHEPQHQQESQRPSDSSTTVLYRSMGAGASAIPNTIDKPTAKSIAGNHFDENVFDSEAKDGVVSKEAFLKAAAIIENTAMRPATVSSKCDVFCSAFEKCIVEEIVAETPRDIAAQLATKRFWDDQASEPYWIVPMGGEAEFSRRCGLLVALERARDAGKTPLIVDNSEDRLVDAYFSYQQTQVLEAKRLIIDEQQGRARSVVLERARTQLIKAMRFGHFLYVRLANSACDFCSKYCAADTLPAEIFDAVSVAALLRYTGQCYTQLKLPV